MRNKVLGAVALAAALAVAGVGVAAAGPAERDTRGQGGAGTVNDTRAAAVFACDGGTQKRTVTRINNAPTVVGETAGFVQLPGVVASIAGPATGADTVNVTFSAETQLRGIGTDLFDWSELQVRRNGVPLQPVGGAGDPLAFNGGDTYGSHAAQFCGRVGRGVHTYTVWQRIVDNGANGALSAWYDDMTLRVEVAQ